MTELSFLLELFLDSELPCSMRDKLVARIREVETKLVMPHVTGTYAPAISTTGLKYPTQAASTLAAMARHGDLVPPPVMPPIEEPQPVAVVAQTPQTAAAMNSRNQAISDSIAGKTDKLTGRPKKW